MRELITLLAVAVGWLLNELSSLIRLRREDRRSIGPVLRDLLEIRHRLFALDSAIAELKRHLPIPAEAESPLKQVLKMLVPPPPRLQERYDEAVSIVARANPLLASRLSRQGSLEPYLNKLGQLAASDPAASNFWSTVVEPFLLQLVKPNLDELILDVAKAHGFLTGWRVRRTLKKPMELTQHEQQQISNLLSQAQTATPPNLAKSNS